jgi:hypothetical protein
VWAVGLAGAVLVGIFAADAYLTWIPIVLAATLLLTFVIQLALQRKEGLVNRVIASIGGALVVLAVATGVFWILSLA